MSNRVDPDQDGHSLSRDLSPNCLQWQSVDDKSTCWQAKSLRLWYTCAGLIKFIVIFIYGCYLLNIVTSVVSSSFS